MIQNFRTPREDIFSLPSGTMTTLSNRKIDLSDPYANRGNIVLSDIAFHLAFQNRFNGACGSISVADHSLRVFETIAFEYSKKPETLLWALLHDAHEAYIGDMIYPLRLALDMFDQKKELASGKEGDVKKLLEQYEEAWKDVIQLEFGLTPTPSEVEKVTEKDLDALQRE